MAKLLSDRSTNSSSDSLDWSGGTGTFWVWGTFDGATIKLEASPDGSIWFDVGAAVTLTDKGVAAFALGPCKLRATLVNAGASTSISAAL
ncbi:MAG: hypothetical protein GC184_03355 [Rhizobiales bacterium]|nr:hypothetical protein [Hyphomicrobiales bacterium]